MLASLAAFAGQAAVIYKWTDANGVVHYSDQSVPGAEKIYTSGIPNSGGSTAPASPGARANPDPQTPAAQRTAPQPGYSIFAITSPTPEQTFFGDEVIGVALAIEPTLKAGDSITWQLNGKPIDDQGPAATQFALPHLDRGTYSIAATVTDAQGQSQNSGSVTFFVRQPSALSPQHRNP